MGSQEHEWNDTPTILAISKKRSRSAGLRFRIRSEVQSLDCPAVNQILIESILVSFLYASIRDRPARRKHQFRIRPSELIAFYSGTPGSGPQSFDESALMMSFHQWMLSSWCNLGTALSKDHNRKDITRSSNSNLSILQYASSCCL